MMAHRSFAFLTLSALLIGALLAGCGGNAVDQTSSTPQLPASNATPPADAPNLKSGPPANSPAR